MHFDDCRIPPSKAALPRNDAPGDQVYLKSSWVVTSLRHPALRLLNCVLHLLGCVLLSVTSPLLTSLQTPARFPVYGDLVLAATSGFSWQKLVFQSVLGASLLGFLRLVAYPRLAQRQWNWRHATRTFSRLSRASEAEVGDESALSNADTRRGVMALHTFTPVVGSARPAVRLHVWNVGSCHGSWTFVTACFPFLWAAVVYITRKVVHQTTLEMKLFPEEQDGESGAWGSLRQLALQKALSTLLIALSCLKLVVTLDWVLQDNDYARVLFGNWLSAVRRVYTGIPVVRLLWCWICLAGIVVGGVYFEAISNLQNQWIVWGLEMADERSGMEPWLLNVSWYAMLMSLILGMDLLWLVQDFEFPSFASPLGFRFFGFHEDQFTLRLPSRLEFSFTSKWVGGFIVLALLLPLELCQFLQIAAYTPINYSQHMNGTTFRVVSLNLTSGDSLDVVGDSDILDISDTTSKMLEAGSLSRYFAWSAWDRAPAFAVLLLSVSALVWLSRKERCKMCFAVFLGLSSSKEEQADAVARLNATLPLATKRNLNNQRRLRTLYKLRARSDSFCIGLAALSVLTVWMQFRAIWRSSSIYQRDMPLQSPGETYAALMLLITLVLLHQVHHRYCLKMEIMALKHEISPDCRYGLWQSPRLLLLPFLTEVLLCGVFLPPLVHGRVHLNEVRYSLPGGSLNVVPACPKPLTMAPTNRACELQYSYPLEIVNMMVLVRLYWFGRVVRNQLLKQVVAGKAVAAASSLLHEKDVPMDSLWWSFRVSFALRPAKLLFTLFILLWASTAATVSIFERPFPSKLDGEDHSLWLSLVTMTGVGYGDTYPITMNGRVAIVLGAVIGGLGFISLMTSEFLDSLKGTKREYTVLVAMESIKWERAVRIAAQRLIYAGWMYHRRLHLEQSAHSSRKGAKRDLDRQLLKAAQQFKLCRKQKPMQTTVAFRHLQMSGLSESYSRDVGHWIESKQADIDVHLEALEQHMDSISSSIQALL